MAKRVSGPNTLAIMEFIIVLHTIPLTTKQLAEKVGVSFTTAYQWVRSLKRRKVIYVESWLVNGTNRVARWYWGYEEDALKPPKRTSRKDYYRQYRLKNAEKLKLQRKQYLERKANEQRKESSSNLSR